MPAPILPAHEPDALARAADILRGGGLVAIPTETVYGLAADATNADAVAKIFAAKQRPHFNPLIAHVTGLGAARKQAKLSDAALTLIRNFWPGPLTIVAPRADDASVCDLACAGLDTIAIRAPAHGDARALLSMVDFPLAAPSANVSGHVSPTSAQHVAEELSGVVDLILDGGQCFVGIESTIVAAPLDGPLTLLRLGAIPVETIESVVGPLARVTKGDATIAPGMLARHYAPRAHLRLNAETPRPGEAFLAFGAMSGHANLSESGDLTEAAARLYAFLRALDATGVTGIAVARVPETGLGEAINDRLKRAAEGR